MKHIFRLLLNKKGAAIVYVVLTLLVATILASGVLIFSVDEEKISINNGNYIRAYYAARSAIDSTEAWIEQKTMAGESVAGVLPENIGETLSGTGSWQGAGYTVSVLKLDENAYTISATATYKGETAHVSMNMTITMTSNTILVDMIFDEGIYATGNVTLIAKNADFPDKIVITAAGTITSNSNSPNIILQPNQLENMQMPIIPAGLTPQTPAVVGGKYIVSQDGDYGSSLTANNDIDFDTTVNDKDLIVVVDNIDCKGTYRIIGTHRLFLYFRGNMTIQANTSFFTDQGQDAFLIGVGDYTTGSILIKTGASTAFGFIYAPGKDISFEANATYQGSVVARNVTISSGASVGFLTSSEDITGTPLGQMYATVSTPIFTKKWQ